MSWLDFFCLVLASGAVIDAWRSGSIFAPWRAEAEVHAAEFEATNEPRLAWYALLDCPFCLSYHVPWYLLLFTVFAALVLPDWLALAKLPLYSLAATRLTVLTNGLLPDRLRY